MGSAGPDIADIDFHDLTSPQLTDVQRQILEFTEAKQVDFDIDRMLAEAAEHAGVSDLADTDGFGDRLIAHVAAIEADDGLRQLTRSTLRQRVVRLLRNRLSLTELVQRYPDREALHRGRDAAIRHYASGESHCRRPAPACIAILGEPGADTRAW
jgi:hypothetical protein